MDSPQYFQYIAVTQDGNFCFKPYYKWIVLNTILNMIGADIDKLCFKPYYKWIVLNT